MLKANSYSVRGQKLRAWWSNMKCHLVCLGDSLSQFHAGRSGGFHARESGLLEVGIHVQVQARAIGRQSHRHVLPGPDQLGGHTDSSVRQVNPPETVSLSGLHGCAVRDHARDLMIVRLGLQ